MMAAVVERSVDYFGDADGQGVVRVFAPEPDPRGDWRCAYQIEWPGYERTRYACGVDAWQALQLAMYIVPSSIFATDDFKAGRIGVWGRRLKSYAAICKEFGVKPVRGPKKEALK